MVSSFLLSHVTPELLKRITDIMVLLGSPFIVFASLMFVRLTREISGRKTSNAFIFGYIIVNVLIIIALGYVMVEFQHIQNLIIKYYFISLIVLFTVFGVYYLLFPDKRQAGFQLSDLIKLSIGLVTLMLLQNAVLRFYNSSNYFALVFILTYFVYGGFIPVFMKYYADLSGLIAENGNNASFENFCELHSISRREKEVIHEICKGLSNQQIADKLFISLQTVKDHTHRIYNKTECGSRARLISMVNESI
jgi:DNA-binding CsgD family transcriptional regulator